MSHDLLVGESATLALGESGGLTATSSPTPPLWVPQFLFRGGESGAAYAIRPDNVFTDTAGTTLAALGDSVARVNSLISGQTYLEQSVAASRPILGRQPAGGVRNLLDDSEDLSTATKFDLTVGASIVNPASEGPAELEMLVPDATNASHIVRSLITTGETDGGFSVYAMMEDGSPLEVIRLRYANPGDVAHSADFNLSTGVVSDVSGAATADMEDVGNGVWRLHISGSFTETDSAQVDIYAMETAGVPTFTGDGTSGVYIGGRQVEASTTKTAYQRRVDQYDVIEAGVADAYYVEGDGTDDFMETAAALDFSGGTEATMIAVIEDAEPASSWIAGHPGANDNGALNIYSTITPRYAGRIVNNSGAAISEVSIVDPPPTRCVLTATVTASELVFRVNGSESTEAVTGLTALANKKLVALAREAGAGHASYTSAKILGIIFINRVLSAEEITLAESYFSDMIGL